MKSSPIYSIISNPGRKSDCSFGSNGFSQEIRVGTSASNSHYLGSISVQRRLLDDGRVEFSMYAGGMLVKQGILDGKEFEMTTA